MHDILPWSAIGLQVPSHGRGLGSVNRMSTSLINLHNQQSRIIVVGRPVEHLTVRRVSRRELVGQIRHFLPFVSEGLVNYRRRSSYVYISAHPDSTTIQHTVYTY